MPFNDLLGFILLIRIHGYPLESELPEKLHVTLVALNPITDNTDVVIEDITLPLADIEDLRFSTLDGIDGLLVARAGPQGLVAGSDAHAIAAAWLADDANRTLLLHADAAPQVSAPAPQPLAAAFSAPAPELSAGMPPGRPSVASQGTSGGIPT